MSKLPALSSEQIISALRRAGFRYAPKRGKGSHAALVGTDLAGRLKLVIVPRRRTVPVGTLLSILEQAGLTRDEFLGLL
jgi:predicted RNA binding protein YcfA (HicA-like mRNA interferase family)